jgi:hypothetical protein
MAFGLFHPFGFLQAAMQTPLRNLGSLCIAAASFRYTMFRVANCFDNGEISKAHGGSQTT